ncbi:DotI/IcmL/TraM family protein [Candidatus Williamhamiltonella defendens]|uniref:TraM conjugal transfer protein n=1 Tax=Hamiltonella defensa subsp. Acyrthosiphon pisum (strain 5AT) TaxID=572265 RepID=C3M8E1_HAMD5|nr:DotI/IcmL/TraM family protein [Candidatus Hamiltonella defensa]ACQ68912.1 TraM conjugal transfer protein [Candidatus Hamiltonella defensa 5AT (Acyrthosiphon pisum)]
MKKNSDLGDNKDNAPYKAALELHHQNQLGAQFARTTLTLCLTTSLCLIVSLLLNGYLGWTVAHPPVKYFATQEGRVIPLIPTHQPVLTVSQVSDFGAHTIREAFTMDFVHFKEQMSRVSAYFSEEGFKSYYQALTQSNVLAAVRDKKMNLAVMLAPGVVRQKGPLSNGVYAWEIQYPVTLKLSGQTLSLPEQRFIFSLFLQRADLREKPNGLEVTQLVTFDAK